jgi:hypothetical protein
MTNDHTSNQNRPERSWEALLEGYRKTTQMKEQDQTRLYNFAGAYLAGAMGLIALIITRKDPQTELHPLFYSAASIANTFYVAFYSYSLTCLMLCADFLRRLANEAHDFIGEDARFLRWEAFSAGSKGHTRRFINLLKSTWLLVPLSLALTLPCFGWKKGDLLCVVVAVVAFVFAVCVGLVSTCTVVLYVIREEARIGDDDPTAKGIGERE